MECIQMNYTPNLHYNLRILYRITLIPFEFRWWNISSNPEAVFTRTNLLLSVIFRTYAHNLCLLTTKGGSWNLYSFKIIVKKIG